MITLNKQWELLGSAEDTDLGYVGENEVVTLRIQTYDLEYQDWNFVLDVKYSDVNKKIWAVEKKAENGKLVLSMVIKKEHIASSAGPQIQVRATHPDGRVKKSSLLGLKIRGSINAPDVVPSPLPSEFEDYEARIQYLKNEVESDADRAASAALCSPQIGENGNWYVWNSTTGELSDTGVRASGNAEWNFYGQTPCRLSGPSIGSVKLVCSTGECEYRAYSDTVKDMESQSRSYYGGLTEDTSKGYYEFTLSTTATAWYNVYFRMTFKDLEIGRKYKIYVDTSGLQPGSTTATMMYGQFLLAGSTNGTKGETILSPTRITYAGLHEYEFIPATTDVMLEYYPGNVVAELVAGYQFRVRDIYINYADAGNAHTSIFSQSGTFTGELVFTKYIDNLHYVATPACSVYYAEAKSRLFTVNGKLPDENGNIDIPISRLAGRTLVCFGDSITGQFSPPTDYPSMIAQRTGMTVYNLGVSGCRMSYHPDQYYEAFSMTRLAEAIKSGDFAYQETAIGHTVDYIAERVNTLKSIDWSKVDYVTIFYGTNDIQGGVALDDMDNPTSDGAFLSACRYVLQTLWGAYPNLKILLLTPMYRFWDESTDSDNKMFGSHHFSDYVDGLLQVAKDHKVPAVDLYHTLGINWFNRLHYFSSTDGTHPNEAGRELLAEKIVGKLLSEY